MLNQKIKLLLFASASVLVFSMGACTKDSEALKVTKSGYEYKICQDESGDPAATGEYAVFDLTIKSGDSTLQSSKTEPVPVTVKIEEGNQNYGKFAPIVDMIRTMSPGDSCVLFFPKDSFATNNPVLDGLEDVLTYEVRLKEIMSQDRYTMFQDSLNKIVAAERQVIMAREAPVATFVQEQFDAYKSGKISGLQKTDSGLEYVIHEEGNTDKPVKSGSFVKVHYYGTLEADNTMFDNSFKRGQTFDFAVGNGQVIPGWDEGLQLLNEGSTATFYIPYALAYGKAGNPPVIPEEADLIFYVEVKEVN